ncbi:MAG: protein-L-isoaspartate(D-aspartate) O-methyltransferase [Planctomycetaceae bacterium]|nr:protein-L-isoaspartate(D-aspartate) O-methyltransferase [Planctomycetaceae bacterium]
MKPTSLFNVHRRQMVERHLRARGIGDERVLAAMGEVSRELFVGADQQDAAYDDCALPIAAGQTISQPYTVAFMCEAARLSPHDKVLEVGAGSGYGAAVLARLVHEVYTVERIPELTEEARTNLAAAGCRNVHVATADGSMGWPEHAPYDAILVTAAADALPTALVDQLAPGGRLVIPIGTGGQTMYRYTRLDHGLRRDDLGGFAFVPLIGAYSAER